MPFSGAAVSLTGAIAVNVNTARRLILTINTTEFYEDQVDTDYEVRGYTFDACQTWANAASNATYKNVTARRIGGGGGLLSYRITTVASV